MLNVIKLRAVACEVKVGYWFHLYRWKYSGRHWWRELELQGLSRVDICLFNAAREGSVERFHWLINLGADPGVGGGWPFVAAAAKGDLDLSCWLYQLQLPTLSAMNAALHWSIENKHSLVEDQIRRWLAITKSSAID